MAGGAASAFVSNILGEIEGLFHHSSNSTKRDDLRLEEGGNGKPISILEDPLPVPMHSSGGDGVEDDAKGFFEGTLQKAEGLVGRDGESSDAR